MPDVDVTAEDLAAIELPTVERRSAPVDDFEVTESGDELIFEGHAAVFDRVSDDLGGFREQIKRGAFRSALAPGHDVEFLGLDHDDRTPMARSTVKDGPGSLVLREDTTGLAVRANLVPTTAALDMRQLVKHRVVTDMSFGFNMPRSEGGGFIELGEKSAGQKWSQHPDGYILRTISRFEKLLDVTPASRKRAYAGTSASMRSRACGVDLVDAAGDVHRDELVELAWKIHRGEVDATPDERRTIDAVFELVETVSPWHAERALRAVSLEPELRAAIPGKVVTVTFVDAEGEPETIPFRLAARRRRLRALGVTTTTER
jgi:HK97 family phage prohead protease